VDINRIRPGQATPEWRARTVGPDGDAFVVGFVGRIRPWHGLNVLLEAFAVARAEDPGMRLCVVGDDGGTGRELQEQGRRLGLDDAVEFTGAIPPEEVPAALGAMDAVAAPYPPLEEFYFSPLKIFEYMAAGKPIVASACGQITDLLDHERTGLLVPPGDVAALAEALLRLRRDPTLAENLGRNARAEAEVRHSWQDRIRTVDELFNSVLAQRAEAS